MSLKKAMSSSLLCFLTASGNAAPLASDLMTLTVAHGGRAKPCRGAVEKSNPSASSTKFSGGTRYSITVFGVATRYTFDVLLIAVSYQVLMHK